MALPISEETSENLTSPKEQKMEETSCNDDSDSDNSEEGTPEEIQLFNDVWKKCKGFDMDCSKFTFCFDWQTVDLDDSAMIREPKTNRDFIATLCDLALTKHNSENGMSLELSKVVWANFHPSAAITLYISFQVNDPSDDDNHEAKPYQAVVRYLPGDIEVASCKPKPPEV